MTSAREPALQLLLDRTGIHDLLMRYAFACDRREFEVQASCFVPDLGGTWGFGPIPDRDTMMDYIHQVARFHTTMHFMGNEFIEVDGDGASLQAFAMLMHRATRRDGTPFQYNPSDRRYSERLERREGRWLIVERNAEPLWAPTGVSAVGTSDPAVRWLLDRAEIHDLMASYALGVDLRDYDRVGACFAPGFRARYGDHEFDDLDPLIEYISGAEHFVSTTHFMGSQLIEVAGDEAAMRTAAIISQREPPDGQTEWAIAGRRYSDRLVRHEGRWRLAERGPDAATVPSANPPRPTSDDPDVRSLLDRAEIEDLVTTFAIALDRRDFELVRSCFAPDARKHAESLIASLREELEPWRRSTHLLGNQRVEIDGDHASVETYAYVNYQRDGERAATHWSDGARRYLDDLVRAGGRWRIARRRIEGPYYRDPAEHYKRPPSN